MVAEEGGDGSVGANVRVIPATINRMTSTPISVSSRRKVAGYARVSTDADEQQTSYEAQVDYYTSFIKGHEDWDFVDVYTDEGISATSTKHREGFQQMVEDALAGKIDLIVTKSVSRFARNTVDSLTTIRKLKEHGTEVFFEKENIWTFEGRGELLLTIMSSLAQEESRSISENVRWGQRKKAADGKFSLNYSHFLGYDKGPDGKLVVNKEQAAVVRRIYGEFLAGKSVCQIAKELTEDGIPTPAGKVKWSPQTVQHILSNEKYRGDALLQKTFTIDFLSKDRIRNEGQVPQYYVEDDHEAIIPAMTFERVQYEIERRKNAGYTSGATVFSGKIYCGDCGGLFGPKVWHSNSPNRRVVLQCNDKFKKTISSTDPETGEKVLREKPKCKSSHLTEQQVKDAFLRICRRLEEDRDTIIENLGAVAVSLDNTEELEAEERRLSGELDIVAGMLEEGGETDRLAELSTRYEQLDDRIREVKEELILKRHRLREIKAYTMALKTMDCTEFKEELWCSMVQRIVVKGRIMTFTMSDGSTLEEKIS